MKGKECYHCRQIIEDMKSHDCWTTTEERLTQDLPEALMDAWLRIRETATGFGEQRIYASHKSIMFSRKACYFFVRPKQSRLEVCFFIGRTVKHPVVRKTHPSSKVKVGHMVYIIHRDEVEPPLTDWLQEAYTFSELAGKMPKGKKVKVKSKAKVTFTSKSKSKKTSKKKKKS